MSRVRSRRCHPSAGKPRRSRSNCCAPYENWIRHAKSSEKELWLSNDIFWTLHPSMHPRVCTRHSSKSEYSWCFAFSYFAWRRNRAVTTAHNRCWRLLHSATFDGQTVDPDIMISDNQTTITFSDVDAGTPTPYYWPPTLFEYSRWRLQKNAWNVRYARPLTLGIEIYVCIE